MARQQTYLVEHYRPGFTAERLEEWAVRVRATAVGMARDGEPVRYLRSTIVPTDESLLCLLEAPSEDVVRAVYAQAEVPFERLTAVISDDTPATTTRPPRRRANRPGGHMFASHTHRRTIICAIVCALLASALTGVTPAGANERTQAAAQERYYSSYGEPETIDADMSAAKAQERYYSSYGNYSPLTVAQSPEPSDGTPWLPIALSVALALAIVAASTTLARRLRLRRRAARVTT
jgi:Protein of unknown function (DUF4242)